MSGISLHKSSSEGIRLQKNDESSHWLFKNFYDTLNAKKVTNRRVQYVGLTLAGISGLVYGGVLLFGGYHSLPGPITQAFYNTYYMHPSMHNPAASIGALANRMTSWFTGPIGIAMDTAVLLVGMGIGVTRQSIPAVLMATMVSGMMYFGPQVLSSMTPPSGNSYGASHQTRSFARHYNPRVIDASTISSAAIKKPMSARQRSKLVTDLAWMSSQPKQIKSYKGKPVQVRVDRLEYRLALPLPENIRPADATAYLRHYQATKATIVGIDHTVDSVADLGMLLGTSIVGWSLFRRRSVNKAYQILQSA